MAIWKTYLGFFQSGEMDDPNAPADAPRTIFFDNFFPVMEQVNQTFERCFPHPDFYRGLLQLKRTHPDHGTPENLLIENISKDITHNILYVVSFDAEKFIPDKEDRHTAGILLDSYDPVDSAIKIKSTSYESVFGSKLKALIHVDDLDPAGLHGSTSKKNACAVKTNHLGLLRIPCILWYDELVSNIVTAQLSSGFNKTIPWFDPAEVKKVARMEDRIKGGNTVPYSVNPDSWDSGHYAQVEELELVELRDAADIFKGRLEYREKKYLLIPSKGSSIFSLPRSAAPIQPSPPRTTSSSNFVAQTTQFLRDHGRDVQPSDVINYCICITQGFITTLAGAPGTGKTTLCRLLAQAMGLEEETGQYESNARYTEISVERGWTSLKDFIGYPNPFPTAGENVPDIIASHVDACNAFRRMHERWEAETPDAPPYLMLLDEANLSPIEYYWSQFLRNCQLDDPDELKKRKINVSQTQSWKISPNLRFLTTVNFDHTTEELSPRFLDRSWVISLKAPKKLSERKTPTTPKPASMKTLQRLFGHAREQEHFPSAIAPIWDKVQQVFQEKDINMPLSPRNILAVEHYCIAAARFSSEEITPKQALDFAILQKILPTISGYGARCEALVTRLTAIAQDFELHESYEKLKEMRSAAEENSQFYQFFVR